MTTSPRPTLDETLARIDAVLTEPTPDPLDDHHLQVVTRHLERPPLAVHRNGCEHPDRLGEVLATVDTEAREEPMWVAYLFGRAIGWFRR